MSKISDKSDKFLLHYSNIFRGPLFIGTQCIFGGISAEHKCSCVTNSAIIYRASFKKFSLGDTIYLTPTLSCAGTIH